jgi:hypothetical protein
MSNNLQTGIGIAPQLQKEAGEKCSAAALHRNKNVYTTPFGQE